MCRTGSAGGAVGTPTEMVTGSAACVELAGGDVGDAAGFSAGLFPLEQPARANSSIADATRDARARFMCDSPFKNFS